MAGAFLPHDLYPKFGTDIDTYLLTATTVLKFNPQKKLTQENIMFQTSDTLVQMIIKNKLG